jgi:hypothetical protein
VILSSSSGAESSAAREAAERWRVGARVFIVLGGRGIGLSGRSKSILMIDSIDFFLDSIEFDSISVLEFLMWSLQCNDSMRWNQFDSLSIAITEWILYPYNTYCTPHDLFFLLILVAAIKPPVLREEESLLCRNLHG